MDNFTKVKEKVTSSIFVASEELLNLESQHKLEEWGQKWIYQITSMVFPNKSVKLVDDFELMNPQEAEE
jgi:hypothetical protein